jgi:hypothetical protein
MHERPAVAIASNEANAVSGFAESWGARLFWLKVPATWSPVRELGYRMAPSVRDLLEGAVAAMYNPQWSIAGRQTMDERGIVTYTFTVRPRSRRMERGCIRSWLRLGCRGQACAARRLRDVSVGATPLNPGAVPFEPAPEAVPDTALGADVNPGGDGLEEPGGTGDSGSSAAGSCGGGAGLTCGGEDPGPSMADGDAERGVADGGSPDEIDGVTDGGGSDGGSELAAAVAASVEQAEQAELATALAASLESLSASPAEESLPVDVPEDPRGDPTPEVRGLGLHSAGYVVFQDLTTRKDLNGKIGRLTKWLPDRARWQVARLNGETIAARPGNCRALLSSYDGDESGDVVEGYEDCVLLGYDSRRRLWAAENCFDLPDGATDRSWIWLQ